MVALDQGANKKVFHHLIVMVKMEDDNIERKVHKKKRNEGKMYTIHV